MLQIANNLKQRFDSALYGYSPDEFLPVFEDGQLANRNKFIVYKAERAALQLGHFAAHTARTTAQLAVMVFDNIE